MEDRWGIVVTQLQDLYKLNDVADFESLDPKNMNFHSMSVNQLSELQLSLESRHSVNEKMRNYCRELVENIAYIVEHYPVQQEIKSELEYGGVSGGGESSGGLTGGGVGAGGVAGESSSVGRSFWTSQFNPSEPIEVGSDVAYKSKKTGEWIQCICTKVSGDGLRFEVKDPEPDEFGKPGGIFKCNSKEILLIPPVTSKKSQLPNYPINTKVLARYPETTTFYPAIVCGSKRDGTCKLRFDGEEEIDKETEVERRLVLPFPSRK